MNCEMETFTYRYLRFPPNAKPAYLLDCTLSDLFLTLTCVRGQFAVSDEFLVKLAQFAAIRLLKAPIAYNL